MTLILGARSQLLLMDRDEKMRELAALSLAHFLRYRFHAEGRPLRWNWHLDYLCELLEGVTAREKAVQYLLISIWPGSLKSELMSQSWQAWMIGRRDDPDSSIVSASNTADLATRDSYATLRILQSEWFPTIFPAFGRDRRTGLPLPWPKERQDSWTTPGGAIREALGVDGRVTGRGARRLLWDDPLDAKQGDSEVQRTTACTWLGRSFRSRLRDQVQGTITGIMQRMHELDPIGYLLNQSKNPDATPYKYIEIPLEEVDRRPKVYSYRGFNYLRRAGEVAHPEMFPPAVIKALKVAMKENFTGQYNQRPTKMEGGKLQPGRLIRVGKTGLQLIRDLGLRPTGYLDIATKEKQALKDDPDFFVLEIWARDQLQRKILLHVWRQQCSVDHAAAVLIDLHKAWGVNVWKGEKGGLQHVFRSTLTSVCRLKKRSMIPLLDLPNVGDKAQKVSPFEGSLNAGVVVVPEAATWLPDFEAEMRAWPKGGHDDQVDVAGQACNDLENEIEGEAPPPEQDGVPAALTGEMLAAARKRAKQMRDQDHEERIIADMHRP